MFEKIFGPAARGASVRGELVAGATTFLTMAYIMFVNPKILASAGLDEGAVFVATCLATAITTAMMGLYARLPVALAPGMGLNAYFTFTVVPAFHGDWRLALGCVLIAGLLFVAISLTPAREWLINALPKSMKLAIAAGIGFFLGLIGLAAAGVVVPSPTTIVQAGNLAAPKTLIAAGAFVVIFALASRRVSGAVLIGILGATIVSVWLGLQSVHGVAGLPPSIAPTFLAMHFTGAGTGAIASCIFVFLLVEMLDTSGTLTAVAHQGKLFDADGKLLNARRALTTDALGTMVGASLGTSPVTAYVESAAGIQAGAKTGLASVTVAVLFLLSLFLAPLAATVPLYATAPALVFVAALMARGLKDLDWDDMTETAPAVLTALAIPLTYSIAAGIGIGFIAHTAIKLIAGRWREVNAAVTAIAALFVIKIVLG
jgi:adenine/guanine/hypoxanthine permease